MGFDTLMIPQHSDTSRFKLPPTMSRINHLTGDGMIPTLWAMLPKAVLAEVALFTKEEIDVFDTSVRARPFDRTMERAVVAPAIFMIA